MKSNIKILSVIILFTLLFSTSSFAQWTNGQAADLVLGQPDLVSNTADNGGLSASTLDGCSGIAIDHTNGKMYVADEDNNRVLRYAYPITSNQQAAEAVLGQPNFTSYFSATTQSGMYFPGGVAVDNNGTLWVADWNNHRVLRFDNAASKSNGANADGVLGQADFTSISLATTQSSMETPDDVFVDNNGTLWVSDTGNKRVLKFNNAANKSNGANADGVLGQIDFTSSSVALTQSGMFAPRSVFVDNSGTLWVASEGNDRVLRFDNAASKSNGANADGVLGQADFTTKNPATTQSKIDRAMSVTVDGSGRLYVAERDNNRVLIFDDAANKSNGANADYVLGQSDFTSNGTGTTASTINCGFRSSVVVDDVNGYLWLSDTENNRIIRFTASSALPVELTYFKGQKTAAGTRLEWQTATEKNNEGFQIERSTDSNPDSYRGWENIGFIQGNGTTQATQNYSFTDEQPINGVNYYRLKQIDFDGKFEYSDIINLTIVSSNSPTFKLFPNPANHQVQIESSQLIGETVQVFSVHGQLVKEFTHPSNISNLSLTDIPSGIYFIKIRNQVQKLIVEK